MTQTVWFCSDTFPTQVIVANITDIVRVHFNCRTLFPGDFANDCHRNQRRLEYAGGWPVIYTVIGQIESESVSFTINDLIPDSSALLPLNDWAPIFMVHNGPARIRVAIRPTLRTRQRWTTPDGATDPDTE